MQENLASFVFPYHIRDSESTSNLAICFKLPLSLTYWSKIKIRTLNLKIKN